MDEHSIYKCLEFVVFYLYLLIVFLSSQMYFIWMDVDKNKLKSKFKESFLKNNIIIVFFVSTFFIFHELIEGINLRRSYLYFELFELLGFICLLLYIYNWYSTLKTCTCRKPVEERLLEICNNNKIKAGADYSFCNMDTIKKPVFFLVFGSVFVLPALFVPVSTIYFNLVLGLLFIPPILVMASIFIESPIISKGTGQK